MSKSAFNSEAIRQIENHFYNLMMKDARVDPLISELIEENGLELPGLQELIDSGERVGWFSISGYMGGIHYTLIQEDDEIVLFMMTSSRMDDPDMAKTYKVLYLWV